MDRAAVREVFEQIAGCLAILGENSFRVRAFENAARAIAQYPGDLAEGLRNGELAQVRGVGPASLQIVRELLETGRSSMLDELREHVPPGLSEMLHIPGLGRAKIRLIHDQLGVETLAELEDAAADGRLAALPRFGTKTAEKIRKGIAFLRRSSEFRLFHHALDEMLSVQRALLAMEGVQRVEIAGSLRRRREIIRDLDLVVIHAGGGARETLIKKLGAAPNVTEFAGKDTALTLRFATGTVVDVFLTSPDEAGLAWLRATGAAAHLEELDARARARGIDLSVPGGSGGGRWFPDEETVYRALGLPWIPPELREGMGEIEAAEHGRLPHLVELRDLRGFLHCHSEYSDGSVTIAEWAHACRDAGYEWMGITDHSQSAAYAGGLKIEDIARQHAEIDEVNRSLDDFRVLKGVEADILEDGSLDYGAEVLSRFDFVIGSVHARFAMGESQMTERVLRAMDDPHLAIIGHPTGRLLLTRDPYAIDLEQVLAKAADRGIAVEVNADPHRLDLDWRSVRRARDLGVSISIGADAHSVAGMSNVAVGLGMARKGWVEPGHVLNTRDAAGFLALVQKQRVA
jgi:DNA polymerase (family 10)